ncbi:MAG: response regulator [Anaerolineae bacterium]|nr:response regulator [Anaerolineae bacterium]
MRILYVEDNEVNQALVGRVARAKQCEVLFVEEGETALDMLAQDDKISLVLLDIELAGAFSGLDVIKTLRQRQDPRPVVAVTAYAMMGDRERILNAGCDQYLPKPLVITDLLALIEQYEHRADMAPAATVKSAPSVPAAPVAEGEAHPAPAAPAVDAVNAAPAGSEESKPAPAAAAVKPEGEAGTAAEPQAETPPEATPEAKPSSPALAPIQASSGTNGTKPASQSEQPVEGTSA